MSNTRSALAVLLTAAALVLTGCTGSTPEAPAESEPAATAPAATSDDGGGSDDSEAPAAGGELTGMVGTADDPEAYEIALLDAEGNPVTSLPAGDYSLTFADLSRMHNFHLTGPGGVDVATDVAGNDETTVEVTLEPGTYTFVCDPHQSNMRGEFEVTG
ncbi:Copper binding protein, plastocyanin/azurin family [Agrococcus baldri]|uniref:Copper binding protein, plastocyanin/azurin family n=1 Tax=Agrococcus baldri TaxID=153730 RepID=A0AA94HPT5_9MICO|nr:plastocyanin/azurin family copper-binding protein [Agrococcus baldri]SFS18151.1 Copper binding protein, plastocyanin/azurin family [Agrococcus baldri]